MIANINIVALQRINISNSPRERIRAALNSINLLLPPKRITINLSPADLLKEGSHYDLAIAIGLLVVINVILLKKFSLTSL